MTNKTGSIIDILILNLKPGARSDFDNLYRELALPMLQRWKTDVIAYGPSLGEEDTYLVVRRYKDLAERKQSQDAYYGSDDWKEGPREKIMALVESYTTVVVPANDRLVVGFKLVNAE